MEYTAITNGESCTLTIGDKSFSVTGINGTVEILFCEVNSLAFADFTVKVKSDKGEYNFSRMGEWGQRFHGSLSDAYNKAVLRSMFVKGNPVLTAVSAVDNVPVHLYENCVVRLSPDLSANRVPLCFVTGVNKGSFELTLTLDTGERFTYSKLGYETEVFAERVQKQIGFAKDKTPIAAKGKTAEFSNEYVSAVNELCGADKVWGAKDWLVAPSPSGRFAIVEFAASDSATFVYNTGGSFDNFAMQINRALEAIDFKREVIRLSDDELRNAEYADYYMASKRTKALQFVRANFAERVIHSNAETWKSKIALL